MRAVVSCALNLLLYSQACGASDIHAEETTKPTVIVTINPEARVSAKNSEMAYSERDCTAPIDLAIQVINTGMVTAQLDVRLTGLVPPDSSVTLLGNELKGVKAEDRILRLNLKGVGFVDVTIAFRLKHDVEDLDGRSRAHLLIKCVASAVT